MVEGEKEFEAKIVGVIEQEVDGTVRPTRELIWNRLDDVCAASY
jgi:hypothetical protein